jgi:hypothetical protein
MMAEVQTEREGARTLDDLLKLIDSPKATFFIGAFFIWAGWFRGARRPAGSMTAGPGRYVFSFLGVMLLGYSVYLLLHG